MKEVFILVYVYSSINKTCVQCFNNRIDALNQYFIDKELNITGDYVEFKREVIF